MCITLVYAQYGSRTCFQTSCKVTNHARFQPRVIFFYFQQMNVKMGHPSHHSTHWRSIRFLTGGFQPLKTKTKPVSGWELLFQQTHNSHPLCFGFFFWLTELAWRGKHNRINQIKVKKEKKKDYRFVYQNIVFLYSSLSCPSLRFILWSFGGADPEGTKLHGAPPRSATTVKWFSCIHVSVVTIWLCRMDSFLQRNALAKSTFGL